MAETRILYARCDDTYVLRLVGHARYACAPTLDRFLDRIFAADDFTDVIIDLSQAESIDSTCLGLLARIANFQREHGRARPVIISPRKDINTVLLSVGFDEFFTLLDAPLAQPPTHLAALHPPEQVPRDALAQVILKAHRTLSGLSERHEIEFRDVVEALEASMQRR